MSVNDELENHEFLKLLVEKYDISRLQITVYNARAQEMIECDHKSLINALSKMTDDTKKK